MRSIFPRINDHRNEAGLVLLPFRCQIHFFDHRHLAATPGPVTYQATLAFFGLCHTFFHLPPNRVTVHLCVISMSSPCLDWAGPDT